VTKLSSRKYLALLGLLAFFWPPQAPAQDVIAGSPYTPVFEIEPRGQGDLIESKFHVRQIYDTNLIASPTSQLAGTYSSLEADFSYVHQRARSILMLNYRGGGDLNAGMNAVNLQLRQNITKRLDMKLTGDWGSIPGGAFEESLGPPTLGGGDQNTEFLARRHVTTDGALSFQYQVSPHTYFAWGGDYNTVRYEPATISSSRSEDGYAAYFYQFTHAQTISFGFSNQWIDFPGTGIHSQVHNVLSTYINNITPRLTFTGYVGPAFVDEVSGTGPNPFPSGSSSTKQVSLVGGASLKWTAGHTNIVTRFDRMYSRGSGQVGTTLRQIGAISFSQNMTRHLIASLNLNYTQNDLVSFAGETNSSYRVQPGLRYQMKSRLWLTGSEGYVHAIGLVGTGTLNRSITTFGVEYDLPNLTLER
jgi:hypothetical protein